MATIGDKLSYSRYRGITCKDRYALSDEYFKTEIDGVLICTDKEQTIDCDGNIVMVWDDDLILHIGRVPPIAEDNSPVHFSIKDNTLTMSWKAYAANDFKHPYTETETIDLTPTRERREKAERLKVVEGLANEFEHTRYHGAYEDTFQIDYCKESSLGDCIYLYTCQCEKKGKYSPYRFKADCKIYYSFSDEKFYSYSHEYKDYLETEPKELYKVYHQSFEDIDKLTNKLTQRIKELNSQYKEEREAEEIRSQQGLTAEDFERF